MINPPESVTKRFKHSMAAYQRSDNCAWIVVTGGFRKCRSSIAIGGCDITFIVELGMIYKGLKTQNIVG